MVAAVNLAGADPARLLKSFRKATKLKGEIKGHLLSQDQRRIFFDLLVKTGCSGSVVVTCTRTEMLGGWAMGTLSESQLYSYLLQEACSGVVGESRSATVTPDGGRYKKAELARIALEVEAVLPCDRTSVSFEDSASLPGLQIVDVIANSVYQMLGSSLFAGDTKALISPLMKSGFITIKEIELATIKPDWINELGLDAQKPPEGGF